MKSTREEDKKVFMTINRNLAQILKNLAEDQIKIEENEKCTDEIIKCYSYLNNSINLLKKTVNGMLDMKRSNADSAERIGIKTRTEKILNDKIKKEIDELEKNVNEQNRELETFKSKIKDLFKKNG